MPRNPNWSRDELIVALDVYDRLGFGTNSGKYDDTSAEVIELSRTLNALSLEARKDDTFRNANGVFMKLCNFLRLDPAYAGKGLDAGSKLDEVVWQEFWHDRARLRTVAKAIVSTTQLGSEQLPDSDVEAPEGQLLVRAHLARERSDKLRREKIARALAEGRKLACEACDVVLEERYGSVAQGFIECHHIVPLATLTGVVRTKLKDLALVCPNCHRILHRAGDALNIGKLRANLNGEPAH